MGADGKMKLSKKQRASMREWVTNEPTMPQDASDDGKYRPVSFQEKRALLAQSPSFGCRFKSGISGLDKLIDGFRGGELVVISGPPKNGKTLLAQTITANLHQEGILSYWFSFEMSPREFLARIPEHVVGYMPNELEPYKLDWIFKRMDEGKDQKGVKAFFIDHLHFLIDLASGPKNLSIDIGRIIRGLKMAARQRDIVIFLLCHSTKALTPSGDMRELNMWDIRDSSFIAQESDTAWIIQRLKERGKAELKVCFHRQTQTWEDKIQLYVGASGLLYEYHDTNDSQPMEESNANAGGSKELFQRVGE